jgi:hypothetical protein
MRTFFDSGESRSQRLTILRYSLESTGASSLLLLEWMGYS